MVNVSLSLVVPDASNITGSTNFVPAHSCTACHISQFHVSHLTKDVQSDVGCSLSNHQVLNLNYAFILDQFYSHFHKKHNGMLDN